MNTNNKISLTQAQQEPVWPINVKLLYTIAIAIILLIIFPIFNPQAFHIHLMIMIFLYATMSQSWNVIAGFSGQISLGHVIFFGIGGYTSSFLFIQYGISPWFGMFFGVIFSVIVAVIIGIPILRLSGHYFAIATLLIGFSFQTIFQRWDLVGAASGIWIRCRSFRMRSALQFQRFTITKLLKIV